MNAQADAGLKVLIIEDSEEAAEAIKAGIEENIEHTTVEYVGDFESAVPMMMVPRSFEVIILDLYKGDVDITNLEGQAVWEAIWQERLVPVIVHTAGPPDLDPPIPDDNPFISIIIKGEGSDQRIAQHLETITPLVLSLRSVENEFRAAIHHVISTTSELIWKLVAADEDKRSAVLLRTARRRLAATMDQETFSSEEKALAWERYIYPPLEDSLLTGDVIRVRAADHADPDSYRLVLSPSCDLQRSREKVKSVLVARCGAVAGFAESVKSRARANKAGELRRKMPSFLTRPQVGGHIALPGFGPVLPPLSANLRDLELIPLESVIAIDDGGAEFERVASVDSPFREQIAWAYLQISGRPGVPDSNLKAWSQEIVDSWKESAEE